MNLVGQSKSGVVVVWLEAGVPMAGQVQHHDAPLLWQIVGHDHPHGLVGSESVQEEEGGRFCLLLATAAAAAAVCHLGRPSSLKVAVLNAVHS